MEESVFHKVWKTGNTPLQSLSINEPLWMWNFCWTSFSKLPQSKARMLWCNVKKCFETILIYLRINGWQHATGFMLFSLRKLKILVNLFWTPKLYIINQNQLLYSSFFDEVNFEKLHVSYLICQVVLTCLPTFFSM